jgi:hypothetical protein
VGYALFAIPWILACLVFGKGQVGVVGLLGIAVWAYAEIRLRPFRRTIKQKSGGILWLSSSSDTVTEYEGKLARSEH